MKNQKDMSGFVQILPETDIYCCDLWPPGTLTDNKMQAYRKLMDRGEIQLRNVTVHKRNGFVTVEYDSGLPHAWTLERLSEIAEGIMHNGGYATGQGISHAVP